VDFGNIESGGVGRGAGTEERVLRGLIQFQRKTGARILVHTHHNLPRCEPALLLCSTRDPLDYVVSSYHYFYKNRYSRSGVSVDAALPHIVSLFCSTHRAQREAASRCEKVVKVNYEDLVSQKENVLCSVVESIYGACDKRALMDAIERASAGNLREFELRQGFAHIAERESYMGRHFVRSGEVGEGRRVLSKDQMRVVWRRLESDGIPTDGSFDF